MSEKYPLLSFIFMINMIKQNIRYEQRETSRLKELDEVKTRLFTNITHEFRTARMGFRKLSI